MNRLTEKDVFVGNYTNESITIIGENDDSVLTAYAGKAIDKLAAYEEIGLEPEDVELLHDENISIKNWNACEKELFEKYQADAKKLIEVEEEFSKFKDLEEQGLLIILPCNYNDTLYWISEGYIKEVWFKGIRCDKGYKPQIICRFMKNLKSEECPITTLDNIGKTVFLTREEAIKVLEEKK